MAKKKGTTSGEEGVLELGFEYDDTGEKAAIQGAENVTKAVTSLGTESKKTSVDLSSISTQLANTKKATNDLTKEQQVLGEVIASLEQKAKKSADSIRDLVKAGTSKGKTTSYTDINRAIAGATGIKPKAFKAIDPVTSNIDSPASISDRLKQIKSITPQVNKALEAQKKLNDAINKHTVAAVKNIETLNTTEEQMKEVGSALVTVSAAITQNTKLTSDADTVMKNHSKNLDSYTKLVVGEDAAYSRLKTTVVDSVNSYGALDTLTRKQTTNFKDQKTALEGIKRILTEKQKLEAQIANTKDDQQKIELLRQQEILLEGAKDNYIALAAKAKDYSNELKIISTLNLKGFKYTPGDTPFTASQSEVQGVMTIASKDFDILKKNTDARKSSTAAIMDEANAIKQASAGRNDYDNMLEENEASLAILKTTLSKNQSVLRGVGTLYSTVAKDVKTYTKHIDESDIATLDLTSKTTVLNKQFTDSRTNLREQTRTLRDQINAQKAYSAELKESKMRQDELNAAREKSRLSSEAVAALSGTTAPITAATDSLALRQSASGAALVQAKELTAAADAAKTYELRIFETNNALGVLSSTLRINRETLASTKLEMVTVTDVLKEHRANLDMDSVEAKSLSEVIENLEAKYESARLELQKSNAAISSHIGAIQEEEKQIVAAYAAIEKAEKSRRDEEAETLRDAEENNATWQKVLNITGRALMRLGKMWSMYITAPLVAAAVQAVKFTATMEMNIKSLEILLHGNAEAAEELYTQVTRYAAETPYEIPDLTAATKQLLAFGSASGDVLHELSMLGDLAQNDAEKLNSVVSAFGKVQARGVAHMRELNRFIMAGVPIIEKLGVVMNMSSDKLFKAVEQGQVSFAAVKQAIESLTSEGERFYNMSETLASTVQGRYSTLSDELNLALKKFADDYMDDILELLEGTIDVARAIQAMSKSQRDVILNWAKIAAIVGVVLIAMGALVTLVGLFQKYTTIILAKFTLIAIPATSLAWILGLIVAAVAGLSFAHVYKSVKSTTDEFTKQKDTILDIASAISNLKRNGKLEDWIIDSYAQSLQASVAPFLDIDLIKTLMMNETEESLVAKLTSLNNAAEEAAKGINTLKRALEDVQARYALKFGDGSTKPFTYAAQESKLMLEARIRELEKEIAEAETKSTAAIKKAAVAPDFAEFLKQHLNVSGLADTTKDINTILFKFKHGTEEAINGTLEQFGRFIGIVPDLVAANKILEDAIALGPEALAKVNDETQQSGLDVLLKDYGKEGDVALRTILNQLIIRPGDFEKTKASIKETFAALGTYTAEAIEDYVNTAKAEFEIENIADSLVDAAVGTPDLELIKQKEEMLKGVYTDLVQTALREVMKGNLTLSFDDALLAAKKNYAGLFESLAKSTKTVDSLKTSTELTKMVEDYATRVSELGQTEVQKFDAQVDALMEKLKGTKYADILKDSIAGLKKNFRTIQFDEVESSLIDQKNALVLTADAYQALTYKQLGFTKEQTASLVTLQKFNDTLTALKGISDSFASGTTLSGDFGKIADSYGVVSKSIAGTLPSISTGRTPTIPGGGSTTDNLSLSTERTKAINAMANAYIRADEATRKLTESSQQYKDFMAKVDKGTWEAAKSTALLSLANEQLITNNIEIANNGKDTNEIQLEFWQSIKNSIAPTDAFNVTLDNLIASYQTLIDLGTDKEKLTALPDAIKAMQEEIAAFNRTPAEAIEAEIFAKKSELMQAAADDLGTSLEVIEQVMSETIPASSDAMSTAIALIQSNMKSFVDFMKNKALKGLQDTAAEYALQLANIGKTPRDILGAELKAAFIKDGGIVTEAVEDQIESILKAFDAIEQSKVDTSVADDLAKIRLEIAQLSMSDLGKTIDNIIREGEAAHKTAEQIKEQIDVTKELYALKEASTKRKATEASATTFSELLQDKTMEGLLAGRDDTTKWLMQHAKAITAYAEANNLSMADASAYAKSVYTTSEAMKTAADAQTQLNDRTKEWTEEMEQFGMNDFGKTLDWIEKTGKDAQWSAEKLEEARLNAQKYYTFLAKTEKAEEDKKTNESFDTLITDTYREGLLAGKDDRTKWIMDNATLIYEKSLVSGQSIGELNKYALGVYDVAEAMKTAADAQTQLNDRTKEWTEEMEQFGMNDFGKTLDWIEKTGKDAQWSAEKLEEARLGAQKYYDFLAKAEKAEEDKKTNESFDTLIMSTSREGLMAGKDARTKWIMDNATLIYEKSLVSGQSISDLTKHALGVYDVAEAMKTAADVEAKIKELDTTVSQFGMSEDEKVIAWAKDLYTNGKIAKTTLDDLTRSLGILSIKAAGMNFSALLTGLNTEAKTVGMSAEDKFMYDNKEIIDAEKTARLETAVKSGVLNYGTDSVASITASVDTEARGQFRKTATATSAADAKAQLDDMQASWKDMKDTAGMSEMGVGLREIERLGAIAGTSAEDIIKLKDEFKEMTKEVAFKDLSKSIGVDILNTALSETVNQIEKIGEAWVTGTLNAQSFGDAMGNISIALVNALPQLLLSAGLNLLTTNPSMWPIALGLIAASGIAALGKGAMNGKMNADVDGTTSAASTIKYSAKGNAFDRGNIITSPTLLTGKNGLNVGGELGTEAIMPLSRDSSGRLGITSSGGGSNVAVSVPVSVTVINQTGVEAETETKQTTNADGSQNIEIMVKKLVNKGIASGDYDRSMTTRYGVKNKGIA